VKGIASTCSCGRRIEPGGHCPVCGPVSAPQRPANPRYSSPEYRKNRMERYHLAGGYCESCGIALRGPLHDEADGAVPWECDHVIELVDGGSDETKDLRVRCVPCHRRKTKAMRRARKR